MHYIVYITFAIFVSTTTIFIWEKQPGCQIGYLKVGKKFDDVSKKKAAQFLKHSSESVVQCQPVGYGRALPSCSADV